MRETVNAYRIGEFGNKKEYFLQISSGTPPVVRDRVAAVEVLSLGLSRYMNMASLSFGSALRIKIETPPLLGPNALTGCFEI
jgi:hypothetical protein